LISPIYRTGEELSRPAPGRRRTALQQDIIDEDRLVNRLIWRLMPLLTIMFLVSFIDRKNVGFAKLQMVPGRD
jgi:hypothetical protein